MSNGWQEGNFSVDRSSRSLNLSLMHSKKRMTRAAVAKLLNTWAKKIRSGKPIAVGGSSTYLPDRFTVETELEAQDGEAELEIEIKWPIPRIVSAKKKRK